MSTSIHPTMSAAMNAAARTAVAPLVWDPVDHLLSRFTYGPTVAARAALAASGPDAWFAHQLTLAAQHPGYSGNAQVAAVGTLLGKNPYDLATKMTAQGHQYWWDAMDQLSAVTLGLQAFSTAQLFETLVDFFSNHLNVTNHDGAVWNSRPSYDLDVIRRHALGSFTDMLIASCKHPAMLTYLNLAQSTKNTINENYAREVLELHTVGLHYTEADVRNNARMLTGRTTDQYGHYIYDDYIHATGAVTVLGWKSPNTLATAGSQNGDALLRYLAAHPYTARRLAQKLCTRFVSDTPPPGLVAAVAAAYTNSGTKILPMVRTILRSEEFWSSRGKKVRRPTENLLATIRLLGLVPTSMPDALNNLHWMSSSLGNTPLDWPAPNGYADVATAWRSSATLLRLWNYQLGLGAGGWASSFGKIDLGSLYGGSTPATSGDAVDLLCRRLTGHTFSAAHKQALMTFLGEAPTTPMSQSAMRWQTAYVVGLILHGPHHALR